MEIKYVSSGLLGETMDQMAVNIPGSRPLYFFLLYIFFNMRIAKFNPLQY
jgi:hypothetical protein